MKTKYIISALLAAGFATAAHAGGVVGDLIVGFAQSGTTTNYELDLGSVGSYQGLGAGSVVNLSSNLSALDLSSTFGSTWASAGTVTLGSVATNGSTTLPGVTGPAKSDWVSQNDGTVTAQPWMAETPEASQYKDLNGTSAANSHELAIQNVENGLNSVNGFTQSSNVTPTAGFISTTAADSWSSYLASNNSFKPPAIDSGTNLSLSSGMFQVLDLYQYIQTTNSTTPGAYLGSLELGSDGSLFFTNFDPIAVPEPSTYAAILGAACLGFVAIRRRKQQMFA
jgi:hypothetical protein